MKKDETKENYLEAIHIISLEKDSVKAIDISNYFGYSRPTISIALKELEKEGYLEFEQHNITLTKKGLKIAKAIYERHEFIAKLLISLGVDGKTAYEDSCKIEHDLSEASFKAIKKATKKLKCQ